MDMTENQQLTETVRSQEPLYDSPFVRMWHEPFMLSELDFEYIKNGKSSLETIAQGIFFATVGFGFSLLAKDWSEISINERYIVVAGVVFSMILYGIGLYFPKNNGKITMDKIQKHFEDSPPQITSGVTP